MIPEGKYKARGIEGQLATSANKGTPVVQVIVEITEDGEQRGERMRWDGWLTDATTQRTMESLRYLGWETDDLDDLRGIDANEVQIVVEHEWNEEKQRNYPRVKWINRLGGGAKLNAESKLEGSAAKNLAARFREQARGSRITAGKPAQGATPGRGPSHQHRSASGAQPGRAPHRDDGFPADDDDGIPF